MSEPFSALLMAVDGGIRTARRNDDRPIHHTEEGIKNFWRWFGDSLVVDDDGAPQVMYHGSYRDVQVFDRRKSIEWRNPSMDTVGVWVSDSPEEQGGAGMYANGEGAALYPVYVAISNPKVYDSFQEFLHAMHEANGDRLEDMNPRGAGCPEALREHLKTLGYDGIAFVRTDTQALFDEVEAWSAAIQRATDEYRDAAQGFAARGLEMSFRDGQPWQDKIDRLVESKVFALKELDAAGRSTEFDRQFVWVAFEPSQIKSVFNSGGFDPADPSIDDALYRELLLELNQENLLERACGA